MSITIEIMISLAFTNQFGKSKFFCIIRKGNEFLRCPNIKCGLNHNDIYNVVSIHARRRPISFLTSGAKVCIFELINKQFLML